MSEQTITEERRIVRYTDGSVVQEGDAIRYQQAPGGILPASGEWKYGTARKFPHTDEERARIDAFNEREGYLALDLDELCLHYFGRDPMFGGTERDRYCYLYSHIVERVS